MHYSTASSEQIICRKYKHMKWYKFEEIDFMMKIRYYVFKNFVDKSETYKC